MTAGSKWTNRLSWAGKNGKYNRSILAVLYLSSTPYISPLTTLKSSHMKTTLKHVGIAGIILSASLIITAIILHSASLEGVGVVGFILSPLIKSLGD